ncbi:MAG: UDP-N-acetylmuramate dehydrogenase [bacterium]
MPYSIQEHVDIAPYSSFHIGDKVRWLSEINNTDDIPSLVSEIKKLKAEIYILGEGCNTIFGDTHCLPYFIIHMNNVGIETVSEDETSTVLKVQAGHSWDNFVEYAVNQHLSGIEALSAIPGSTGAAPVQNIGAYGQEVCQTITRIHAYDLQGDGWVVLKNIDCAFSYRNSIFKTSHKNRYIITAIEFRLSKLQPAVPNYPDVRKYFENVKVPKLPEIRKAIIDIRSRKLPDPKVLFNVGSYFENVLVDVEVATSLQHNHPDIPVFDTDKPRQKKIPTAWLIDQCGLKGKSFGSITIYNHNALVLTNNGKGTFNELRHVENFISDAVYKKFKLRINREPNILS